MTNYYILGGNGFIGSKIVKELAKEPANHITVADREISESLKKLENVSFEEIDFLHMSNFDEQISSMDVIYHLICTLTPEEGTDNALTDLEKNVQPTIALLNSLKKYPNKKLVFISSGGTVYGECEERTPICEEHVRRPLCSYGVIKNIIEQYIYLYAHMDGIDYRILRLGNPFGTKMKKNQRQGLVPIFIDKILKKEPISIYGDGLNVRDYIHVDDAVQGILAAEKSTCEEKTFNIGSGKGYSIFDILGFIVKELKCEYPQIQFLPHRKCDVCYNVLDTSLLKARTGWDVTTSLEEGIRIMVKEYEI